MRILSVLAILASLFSLQALSGIHVNDLNKPEITEETHRGELTAVTTTNMWISADNKNNTWVIDKEGTPERKYVVDTPAQKEISHNETVWHAAITHEEPVYSERTVYYVSFPYAPVVYPTETYYDYNEALAAAGERDGDITSDTERYISSYTTVTDQAAWSETVKVIDQRAREEKGHYETEIVGEEGHWEQGKKTNIGKGDGKYQSKMTRSEHAEAAAEGKKSRKRT